MDFDEEMRVVYTCGLCETICEEYLGHECLKDYNHVYLDENYYFFPLLDDKKTIVRRSLLPNDREYNVSEKLHPEKNGTGNSNDGNPRASKKVMHNNGGSTVKRGKKLNDDEVELLLLEVQSRPALWDFELPLGQRTKEIVATLWEEVSQALNGQLTADGLKKNKSLRDTHRRLIADEHKASGSGRVDQKEKWKFYNACEFLRDSSLIRPTGSNVTNDCDENEDDHNASIDDSEATSGSSQRMGTSTSKRARKRLRDSQDTDAINSLNRIADKMCNESVPPVLPPPPTIDAIDNFITGIGHEIRKLPQEIHFDVILEIMQLVRDKEKESLA